MYDVALIQRFLPSRSRGGVGYFTHGLAQALVRRGHRVTVFSQDPAPARAAYRVQVVPLPETGIGAWLAPFAFPFALARCSFQGFDVVHAQGDDQFIRTHDGPPVVRTMHGTSLAEAWCNGVRGRSPKRFLLHGFFFAMEILADLRADYVVMNSQHTTRFYPRAHSVIGNGVDLEALAPDGTPKSEKPSVLFIGEIDSRKRGRLLMDVMTREVRAVLPEAELWLVSPERVEGPGLRHFDAVDDAQLATLFRRAWVLCLPSAYEGFGRPYLEAMAAGTAVVASPNPGAREVLEDGRDGVIARDEELGAALVRLLTHAPERAEYERLGRVRAQAFGWDEVARQYERVYEVAIDRRRRRRA
jgi:glycosyltransferase involved in cell wall biosynthesis